MDNEMRIFETDSNDIALPGQTPETADGKELMSEGIEEAILEEEVKTIILPEEYGIITPNYVIDMSDVEEVDEIQIRGLDALLNRDGDLAVYIHRKGSIQKIGMAYSWILSRIIVQTINNIFNGKCIIYKDLAPGKEAYVVSSKNVSHLRLGI